MVAVCTHKTTTYWVITMDQNTTALELLSSGATIDSSHGLSASNLLFSEMDTSNRMQDLSLMALLKKGAIVTMISGLGLLSVDNQVLLFEETESDYEILSHYPHNDDGMARAIEDLDFYALDVIAA